MTRINLSQFVRLHNHRFLDFDGKWGGQCVDLVQFYLRDCCGIAPLGGNAIDEFNEDSRDILWTRNNPARPLQIPSRGAVMIWGPNRRIGTGVYGHTAVVLAADRSGFTSFDQNWPLAAPCHSVRHTYEGVIGWGLPRALIPVHSAAPAAPAPSPASPPVVNPPLVAPDPIIPPEVEPVENPPAVDVPEPVPVAEAGVTSSEWKAFLVYAGQAAAAATAGAIAHFGFHVSDATLGLLVQLEFGLAGVAGAYILSRGIRKHGAV